MKFPWENDKIPPEKRREMLEDSFNEFINNPFWKLLQREVAERERTGIRLLRNPEFSGEQIKYYQGEANAWSDVPDLPRRIYDQEDSILEYKQLEDVGADPAAAGYDSETNT